MNLVWALATFFLVVCWSNSLYRVYFQIGKEKMKDPHIRPDIYFTGVAHKTHSLFV